MVIYINNFLKACIIGILFMACQYEEGKQDNAPPTVKPPNLTDYVLIINNYADNLRYTYPSGARLVYSHCDIQYMGESLIKEEYCLDEQTIPDTISIRSDTSLLDLTFKYKVLDEVSFLLKGGDTVEFTFEDHFPVANVINRSARDEEINFEHFYWSKAQISEFSSAALYTDGYIQGLNRMKKEAPDLFVNRKQDFKDIDSLQLGIVRENELYYHLLDSLHQQKAISDTYYRYYQAKKRFDQLDIFAPDSFHEDLLQQYTRAFNDSLVPFHFYYASLERFWNYFPKVKSINFIKESNGSHVDARAVFDTLSGQTVYPSKTKELLLRKPLERVVENFSFDDIQTYLSKYVEQTQDSSFYTYLSNHYNLNFENSNELQLKTMTEKDTTFSDLLASYQGKVVYVDFWASWCAPCVRAMPASQALHQGYSDEDVAFLYLSIDEKTEQWQKAAKKYEINGTSNSYLVYNQHTSKMIEDLQVASIPRYLIYNRQGELVHKNAPGPASKEIRKLLDQYVTQP